MTISNSLHGFADYATSAALLVGGAAHLGTNYTAGAWVAPVAGALLLAYSLLTDYPLAWRGGNDAPLHLRDHQRADGSLAMVLLFTALMPGALLLLHVGAAAVLLLMVFYACSVPRIRSLEGTRHNREVLTGSGSAA